ncbi:MAG TPA: PQQ-dependent sugar dehydrogenase [Pseudolabrys sp.]|nr:PQQ-dependent sugar dehydrogenase [Pseudolabrys sp.]
MRLSLALAAALSVTGLAQAADPTFPSSAGNLKVETVAGGLMHPWSLAFLPDGRMLVTERPGRMRIVARNGRLSPPLGNVPKVFAVTQAGLLDVILDRNYAQNQIIYFSYAEPFEGGGRTALARARLDDGEMPRLAEVKVIYRQYGPPSHGHHFGSRIVQEKDGNLFVTNGEHFTDRDKAQTLDTDLGKIVHITPDGAPVAGNPFTNKPNARPEIWSYGHRNPQGLAFNPADGKLWEQEHGPMGGDEINLIVPGHNYGWPLVSYGVNYSGTPVGTGKAKMDGVDDPVWHWTPSIAPSGMAFYTGDLFPVWKGSLFNGALKFRMLVRLELNGDKVVKEERLLQDLQERIRDVRQGPDGALYLLTDNSSGRILRVVPAK